MQAIWDGVVVSTHTGYSPEMDLVADLEGELGLESGMVMEEEMNEEEGSEDSEGVVF